MKLTKQFLFCVLTLFLAAHSFAEHHWENVNYQTIKVSDNIYTMIAEGGNIAVFIGSDGTFLIDDQFAPLTEKIIKQIEILGGEIPKYLVNTHWHFDHTGGNENFGQAGTLIVAHDNVRKLLATDNTLTVFNKKISASPKQALPVITFSKDTSFHINDETVRAFHLRNAHTNGDSVVHFKKANVIHTGDIWFNGFYPFIDVEHGGSVAGMVAAATEIIDLSDEKTAIIPGHGPVGNKAELTEYRDMLSSVLVILRQYKKQGKKVDEVVALKPTQSLDAVWGDGFLKPDQWIRIIYDGLEVPEQ